MSEYFFRKTLIEQTTSKLREEILLQSIPAGTHITTQSIAKRYNISLTPVREAFQTLHSEHLIQITPYKGARVCVVDVKYLNNLYDIMRYLEVLIVEHVFDLWSEEFSRKAHQVNREYSAYLDFLEAQGEEAWRSSQAQAQCLIYNSAFHDPMFDCCDNELALTLFRHYQKLYHITRKRSKGLPIERRRQSVLEHEAILQALDQRDLSAFREAYNMHSMTAKKAFLQSLDEGDKA